MTGIQRFQSNQRMSQVVCHGGLVYLSGQVDLNKGDTAKLQTSAILARVDELLNAHGSSREYVLSASIWLSSMDYFADFNEIWDAWVTPDQAPARACVQSELALPEFLVEVSVIAAVK
jgi:enamine deaminase RidA (YjgF/YER057c/UK114 family)